MAHRFTFTVEVEVERESGKFMTRDEMEETIRDWLERANEDQIDGGPDGDSVYTVADWTIS